MEYVAGKTLDLRIGRRGLSLGEALRYGAQVADALAAAHTGGIVHRDLKPANIMVTESNLVKVLDFGLAKLTQPLTNGESGSSSTLASLTEEGRIMGTVAYMSPEQAEGRPVDARADIFCFGSVLYQMITGRRAFAGDSAASTISEILKGEPAPLTDQIPQELEKLIARCLRKDPARRFQHMGDIKIMLEDLKEESDSAKRETGTSLIPGVKHHWRVYLSAAASLLLIAAVALYSSWRQPKQEAPLSVVPLTSYPGMQQYPNLSPDGREVAFCWNGEKQDNFDIYIQMVSGGPPQRPTTDPAPDLCPQWAPDGN